MAIAYYVPPEYGPPQQQAQQGQAEPQAADPPIIDLNTNHFNQDANNNNVGLRRQELREQRTNQVVSLFTGLVTELLAVFGRESGGVGNQSQRLPAPEQSIRMRRNAARDLRNIEIPGNEEIRGDNQAPHQQQPLPLPLPDLIPSPFRSLPDIVTCHAGMSFTYNSTSTDNSPRDRPPVVPLSPTSSNHHPPTSSMDFEVSLKLEMSVGQDESLPAPVVQEDVEEEVVPDNVDVEEVYRVEGRRLRAIADSFERSRRSSSDHRPSSTQSFELKIVISFAVPTVALVGLGLAYLRRS